MKLQQMALVGSLLFVLVGCGNDSPVVDQPTTTGGTTGGTTGSTTGGTTGGFPFPTTTGGTTGATTGSTTGSTTGNTTGATTGSTTGSTTGGATGTISGTVTAPPGGDVTGSEVVACAESDIGDGSCEQPFFAQVGSTGAYTLTGLQTTPYFVLARKDVDGSGLPLVNGDYLGAYPNATAPTAVAPPAANINITLEVISDGGTPTEGDLTGTWTGTTTTEAYGVEQTTFELTQNSSSVSGTLTVASSEGQVSTSVTGSVSGSSVTLTGTFPLPNNGAVVYSYNGTVSGTTYSGTVSLSGITTPEQGQFSVAQSSASTAPLGNVTGELLNHIARDVR